MSTSSAPFDEPDPFADLPADEGRATPATTRSAYLARASRGYATIRRSFMWTSDGAGPLHRLIALRSTVALDLYLLRLALQSVVGVSDIPMPVWARMLGPNDQPATESAVARALQRLEDLKLATPHGSGRSQGIELLREDGSGQPYQATSGTSSDPYFSLPFDYWDPSTLPGDPALFSSLGAPGKAMLLILLAETQGRPTTPATVANIVEKYGISQSTGERGLVQLSRARLLLTRVQRKTSAERPDGLLYIHHRALAKPYSTVYRDLLREMANDAQQKKKQRGGEKKDESAIT